MARREATLNQLMLGHKSLRDLQLPLQGHLQGVNPPIQCHRCSGWATLSNNCPNREPTPGSVEWGNLHGEAAMEGCTSSPGEGAPPKQTVTSKALGGGNTGGGIVPGPQYHNPDPLVRLIGTPNESKVEVEGVPITALIDSGANLSAITKSFAEELQLEIKGLQTILDIEATGGGKSAILRCQNGRFKPTSTNSLNDEGGSGMEEEARTPDHIQMDVEFPPQQLTGNPVPLEVKAVVTQCHFPYPGTC